ncbi:MAG: sulfate adenylyltransferase subunit CysN [Alphaproteobacteria bacterium]|nr:sulfate adenylyltransferase subunit CysN [Alphaproteobacteria bacterium]
MLDNENPQTDSASLLQFITCGSVDDGKSTLIGRLLFETGQIPEDHLQALTEDSKKFGTTGEEIDYALLIDGLSAEREQGITIDVAYRYFSHSGRKFIVADTPGHEQYTRNMATGASNADLAIIMIDARKGMLPQTKRHSFITSMVGVKSLIVAINKMDLVNFDEAVYLKIKDDFLKNANALDFEDITFIPLSALKGDNIVTPSPRTNWYDGPTLLSHLVDAQIVQKAETHAAFAMPVQWVNRPNLDFRGYAGTITAGHIKSGQKVIALPSRKEATVNSITTSEGTKDEAFCGEAVTITLNEEIDLSRGDVLTVAETECDVADILKTHILWMNAEHLVAGRQYIFQSAAYSAKSTLSKPDYKVDIHNYEQLPCKTLELNEIGSCTLFLDRPLSFQPYKDNRTLGSFILINPITNETVAMGMIDHDMRRAHNIFEENMAIDRAKRSEIKNQKPCVIWMTGLSGAGKSTIANVLEQKLYSKYKHTITLDGDNVRHGLNKDLGFSDTDRAENIRRIAEVSKLMLDAGMIAIVSFISPFRAERDMARDIIGTENFIEAFINTPLQVAEERDVKGLYKKARSGEIPNFTGIGSPYEAPTNPELDLKTVENSAEDLADQIIAYLEKNDYL